MRGAYPEAREPLRRAIAEIIHSERNHWKDLSAKELGELQKLHARFEAPSLGARLQQHVGQTSWYREEQPDLRPLAKELLSAPKVLMEQWPWLTSGDASDAWRLGEAFAAVDSEGDLAETLPSLPGGGSDLRLLCGLTNREWFRGKDHMGSQKKSRGSETSDPLSTEQVKRDALRSLQGRRRAAGACKGGGGPPEPRQVDKGPDGSLSPIFAWKKARDCPP